MFTILGFYVNVHMEIEWVCLTKVTLFNKNSSFQGDGEMNNYRIIIVSTNDSGIDCEAIPGILYLNINGY